MLVVGTAGHIDHGKSSIVRRLTGTDPDRLPEEKERGMTIDLGFAFYNTKSSDEIAFIDVPGHERFVKNMIAGAGGIDVVMLVIAADDGWMPQSQEHFQIIRLLDVHHGLIVINKIDLSTPEWVALLEDEIRKRVSDSPLASSPIFPVSAQTGAGFDRLNAYLDQLPQVVQSKADIGKPRLFVDRSFVRPGIGGVVTGTLRGGSLSVGQTVSVWPSCAMGKIRSLQSTNSDVSIATPGRRTAVAVTGVEKDLLVRGGVISGRTDVSYFKDHPVLAVSVQMLAESPVVLEDRRRVFLMVGTTEMEGELRLFDSPTLKPGQTGIAFVRPDEPMFAHVGDRFIMRLPTPMVTLGGGKILDHLPRFPRRRELGDLSWLARRLSSDLSEWILSEIEKQLFAPVDSLLDYSEYSQSAVTDSYRTLIDQGRAQLFGEYLYIPEMIETHKPKVLAVLNAVLTDQPHLKGAPADLVAKRCEWPIASTTAMLKYLTSAGEVRQIGDVFAPSIKETGLKGVFKEAHSRILAAITAAPYAPPSLSEFTARGKVYQQAIAYMLEQKQIHKCGADFIFLQSTWDEICRYIRDRLNRQPSLSIGDLKEEFGFTRKWAVPILEETDRLGLTERKGDVRIKGPKYDA